MPAYKDSKQGTWYASFYNSGFQSHTLVQVLEFLNFLHIRKDWLIHFPIFLFQNRNSFVLLNSHNITPLLIMGKHFFVQFF